jgi:hypothetical protein
MRRPNFKGWVSRELKYLSGEDTLNLRRLAYLAQGQRPRLRERLVLYALSIGQEERLRGYLYDETLLSDLGEVEIILRGADLDKPDREIQTQLPSRYQKALDSYRSAYYRIDNRSDSKRLRWERTVQLQKEKGLSNTQIYRALDLNPGNINAYLKHGDIDRVTLATATKIMKYAIDS